jgi:hypothetical protein
VKKPQLFCESISRMYQVNIFRSILCNLPFQTGIPPRTEALTLIHAVRIKASLGGGICIQ